MKAKLEAMSSSELVALYNDNVPAEKHIKKFSDKATAVKRTLAVLQANNAVMETAKKTGKLPEGMASTDQHGNVSKPAKAKPEWPFGKKQEEKKEYVQGHCPTCGTKHDQTPAGEEGTIAGDQRNFCHHCSTEYWRDTGKVYKSPKESKTLSYSISASWKNLTVAEKRTQRDGVHVKGHGDYRSTKAAFVALHLPLSGHIKFRMGLKAEGKAVFEKANGEKLYFTIAK